MLKGALRQNFTSRNTASVKVHYLFSSKQSFRPIASQLQQLWSLFYWNLTTKFLLPRCSSVWLTLFFWTRCMWLVHVQAALCLEMGGWRWALWERRHAGCCFATYTRLALCVCVCVFIGCYLRHLYWPMTIFCGCTFVLLFVCFTRTNYIASNVSRMSLNYCFRLKLVLSCLIIVVPSRALPIPASKRDKSPSTSIHSELLFSVTTLYCDRLPG